MKKCITFLVLILGTCIKLNAQSAPEDLITRITKAESEAAKFPDEGITGTVHQANMGKILFSSWPITEQTMNSDPAQYKSTFVRGDLIYARAFLSKGNNKHIVVNQGYVKPNFSDDTYKSYGYGLIYADGKLLMKEAIIGGQPQKFLKNSNGAFVTTCKVEVVSGKQDGGAWVGLVNALNSLTPGLHKMKIEFWGSDQYRNFQTQEPMATGEFDLDVKENLRVLMGKTFEDLELGMINKDLEAKFVIAMKEYATQNKYPETYLKARISSKEWNIIRDKYSGQITSRYVRVYGYAKWPDGHCAYHLFEISESYNGTQYMKNYSGWSLREAKDCDCTP